MTDNTTTSTPVEPKIVAMGEEAANIAWLARHVASKETDRPALQGVYQDGNTLAATDGFILGIVPVTPKEITLTDKTITRLDDARITKGKRLAGTPDTLTATRVIVEGTFPNYLHIMPHPDRKPRAFFAVDAAKLRRAIEGTGEDTLFVSVYSADDVIIMQTARNSPTPRYIALMPLHVGEHNAPYDPRDDKATWPPTTADPTPVNEAEHERVRQEGLALAKKCSDYERDLAWLRANDKKALETIEKQNARIRELEAALVEAMTNGPAPALPVAVAAPPVNLPPLTDAEIEAEPRIQVAPPSPTVVVRRNEELNGIEIAFRVKPDEAIRHELKANGWRWHHVKQLWYSKFCPDRWQFATALAA